MRTYVDQSTVGQQNVYADAVIIRPSVGADDAAAGIFTTWAAAHAAAALLPVPMRTIYVDAPGATVTIEAGAYDMTRMQIVGYPSAGGATSQQQLETAVGTTFTNWTEGCEGCILSHQGNAPLFDVATAAPNALRIRTGKNAAWRSPGNAAPVVQMSGTGGLFIDVEEGAQFIGDVVGLYEVIELTAAGGEIELRMYDNSSFSADSLRGPGGSTINVLFVGVGPTLTLQANFAGTLADFRGAENLYYAATPANWVGAPPETVGGAIDRIAAALGPIA